MSAHFPAPTRFARSLCTAFVLPAFFLASCTSDSPTSPTPPAAPTVTSIAISGTNSLGEGETSQLTATAQLSDGSTRGVSDTATWTSNNAAVARVSASGRVTAVTAGTAMISATAEGRTGQIAVEVTAVDNVQGVTVRPTRVVIDGTCDTDSIFEGSGSGEFTFLFEVERSGSSATSVWRTTNQSFSKGSHSISGRSLTFSRNVTRGDDFIVWFTGTELDGLLGADSKLSGKRLGQPYTYQSREWSPSSRTSLAVSGGSECGATVHYTITSVRQ